MELHAYLKASVHIYVCVSAPGLKGSLGEHMEWWVKKVCRWWGTETSLTQHSGCWITARRFYLSAFNTPRWVEHTKTRTTYLRISEICFIGPQRFYAVFKKVENDFNLPFNLFLIYRQEVSSERDGPVTAVQEQSGENDFSSVQSGISACCDPAGSLNHW